MPGRRPKPTHLHVVQGTYNTTRHRNRALEPKPAGTLNLAPDWCTPAQRDIWQYGLLHSPQGLLKPLDASVYTVWVVACDTHRQAAEQLAKLGPNGLIIRSGTTKGPVGPNGQPTQVGGRLVASPLVGLMNRQALLMIRSAAELGFSPAARAKVVSDRGQQDPEDEFLA